MFDSLAGHNTVQLACRAYAQLELGIARQGQALMARNSFAKVIRTVKQAPVRSRVRPPPMSRDTSGHGEQVNSDLVTIYIPANLTFRRSVDIEPLEPGSLLGVKITSRSDCGVPVWGHESGPELHRHFRTARQAQELLIRWPCAHTEGTRSLMPTV